MAHSRLGGYLSARGCPPEPVGELKPGPDDAGDKSIVGSIRCTQRVLHKIRRTVVREQRGDRVVLGRVMGHRSRFLNVPGENLDTLRATSAAEVVDGSVAGDPEQEPPGVLDSPEVLRVRVHNGLLSDLLGSVMAQPKSAHETSKRADDSTEIVPGHIGPGSLPKRPQQASCGGVERRLRRVGDWSRLRKGCGKDLSRPT
jgi:hypothetical protein